MFADFLQAYLPVVESLRFGHPLAVEHAADPFPELDFGPVISADKATELRMNFDEGVRAGGIPLVHRTLHDGRFLDGQDKSAYVAPATHPAAADARGSCTIKEPFGPLDSIVLVDTESEFLAAMNASNGVARRVHRHATTPRSRTASPTSCRRSRSASTRLARAATARRSSAARGRRGRAPSSAATCSSRPSPDPPTAPRTRCSATSPSYSLYPPSAGLPAGA